MHDSRERDPLTSVRAFAGRVPGVEPGGRRPIVYGRRTGDWLQYWLLFGADDAGPRHAAHRPPRGRLGDGPARLRRGRAVRGVYAQHAGAERAGFGWASRQVGRPLV